MKRLKKKLIDGLTRFKQDHSLDNFKSKFNEKPTERERYWTNIWLWIVILAFFCGYFVSAMYYSQVANEKVQDVLDVIIHDYYPYGEGIPPELVDLMKEFNFTLNRNLSVDS